ncbi:MAG TPA: hypothetical protein VN668_08925 [Stellaceae bacterium]|nr:hypothetical protein [Stellaceae bacterium]
MPHFEVHTLAQDRWLIDGIFVDKETAIDDAKLLLGRSSSCDAVRVLHVEERQSSFFEWTIYAAARPRPNWRRRIGASARAAANREPPAARPTRAQPRLPGRPPSAAPALLLVAACVIVALSILAAPRPAQPKWVWVFDRPEAWQQHPLRNPWSGALSK